MIPPITAPEYRRRPLSLKRLLVSAFISIATMLPTGWVLFGRRHFVAMAVYLPQRLRSQIGSLLDRLQGQTAFIERDYMTWIARYQQIDEATEAAITMAIAGFTDPPLISVLMPVFNPQLDHLRAAIRSVQQQIYQRWELCIADDASTDPAIGVLLREMQADDPRIKVAWRTQNGHISASSNTALELATGTFVALLDHDDLLSPRALFEVAARIVERPDVDVIYSDEDHIDAAGRHSHPYFKPGWNPELLLGQNLISHLGVFRRALMERIGGFRVGFEGSQDYDLALRVVAQTTLDRVVHIPMVLYHWRQGAGTRTFSEASHNRCVANGRQAVLEYATREHNRVRVIPAPLVSSWSRIIYPIPVPEPMVSVIIATDDGPVRLRRCLDGLLHRTYYSALEVVLVHGSPEVPEAVAILGSDPRVRLLHHPGSNHASALRNWAVEQSHGSIILLFNSAIGVGDSEWLREMVSHAVRPEIGAVGAKLSDAEGSIQHGGLTVDMLGIAEDQFKHKPRTSVGYFGHLQLARNVTAVSADCLMLRRESFCMVGGLDESSPDGAFSDIDLCLKLMEHGLRNLWTPYAELFYDEPRKSATTAAASDRFAQDVNHMRTRWGDKLRNDPYWNPNLSREANEIALAFPPRVPEMGGTKP